MSTNTMQAMVLEGRGQALQPRQMARPVPASGQALVAVEACGVCRTDLHLLDGELADISYPIIPGHQIVGRVVDGGDSGLSQGLRVGVPWLGYTCDACGFCRGGQENLCDHAQFTGYHRNGGYAEYVLADARFCLPLPSGPEASQLAPLLCAGLIGYRSLRLAGFDSRKLGLFGYGAAAHLLTPLARHLGMDVFAFTRPGDSAAQQLARKLGCAWAGGSDDKPDVALDAAIIFAPVGALVPLALGLVRKGGRVVCGGIHMSDIPSFPYELLWGERQLLSVANLTRDDGREYLQQVAEIDLRPQVKVYPLAQANEALGDLRHGRFSGAAVLQVAARQA